MRNRYLAGSSPLALSQALVHRPTEPESSADDDASVVTLFPIVYNKEMLASVPEDERVLHFMMQQIANDIASLQRLLILHLQEPPNEVKELRSARTGVAVMLLRFLAGRLYEAWNVLDDPRHARVRGSYQSEMEEEACEAFEKAKRYFKSPSGDVIKLVRHNVAFHTKIDTMKSAYAAHGAEHPFTDFIANEVGNTFYEGASNLTALAITHLAGETDMVRGVGKLVDETISVGRSIMQYAQGFMLVFVHRHVDPEWSEVKAKAIKIGDAPRLKDLHTPYFAVGTRHDIDGAK